MKIVKSSFFLMFFIAGCGEVGNLTPPIGIDGKTIKAEFTQIKKVDILKLTEYSAEFEVSDEKAVKIVLVGENKITPGAIDLIDKKGSIKSLLVDYTVTKIGVKAVNKNGEKVGESIEVELK